MSDGSEALEDTMTEVMDGVRDHYRAAGLILLKRVNCEGWTSVLLELPD